MGWMRGLGTLARRWIVLWAILFWQGGFMFYGGVVVPVGGKVLGSDREQGFVTAEVTNYLNLAGAVALGFWLWDILAERGPSPLARRLRLGLWAALAVSLLVLVWQHAQLDRLIDPAASAIHDRGRFGLFHSLYLFVSTVQWMGCLGLSALTLWAWQAPPPSSPKDPPAPHA